MVLLIGCFICSIGNISFGFLDDVTDTTLFLSLSFLIRILTAIGESAIGATAYGLAADQVTAQHKGKAIAVAEACFGAGSMLGPSLGGFLFDVGGFPLPFWVAGGSHLVVNLAACFLLKKPQSQDQHELEKER